MATNRKRSGDLLEILQPHIGETIVRLREEHRYSQERLAREAGMDPKTLGRLERGEGPVRQDYIEGICRIFKIDLADFLRKTSDSLKESKVKGTLPGGGPSIAGLILKIQEAQEIRAQSERRYLDAWLHLVTRLHGRRPDDDR